MPAAYAHYCFGKEVYKELPEEEKEWIREGKDAFLLGVHGPDLLFYYFPLSKNRINQQGVRLHKELAADFFEKGLKEYRKSEDPVLRAYLYGFLCHFILDSECHPYINCYMEEKNLGHLEIETEFDRYLMERDGKDPLQYVPIHHLISRSHTRRVIASMFDRITPRQIDVCIRYFRHTMRFFVCRNRRKQKALQAFFYLIGQGKGIGGLIADGVFNTHCAESDQFLEERLTHSAKLAAEEITNYSKALDGKGFLSMRLYRNYEEI